jgi:hypothetical protein
MIPSHQAYQVLLVTQPPIHAYGVISDEFCTPLDQPSAVPWGLTDPDSIPPLLPALHFRRHFALCLVRREVWTSRTKSLADKFEDQLFWDYHGNHTTCSQGTTWPSESIRKINAIQDLGIALSGEDAANLCTECKCHSHIPGGIRVLLVQG